MPTPLVPPPRRTPGANNAVPRTSSAAPSRAHHPARLQNRRRRRQIVVLAVIAVVLPALALSAWKVLQGHAGADGPPPATAQESTAPSPPEQSPAPTATSDLIWVDHQGTPLPVSATAGPTRQDGPLEVGYAKTDLGAVLAAVHISWAAGPSAGATTFRPALEEQVTGPARQALQVAVEKDYSEARARSGLRDGQALPAGDANLLGYRVEQLPASNRHVQLILTSPAANGAQQVYSVDVVMTWQDGDWRLLAPSAGTWNSVVTQLPDVPAGITVFDPAQPRAGGDD